MQLVHYSSKPLTGPIFSVAQSNRPHFKPHGLWVTIEGEGGWKDWCEAEEFQLATLVYVHDVELADGANVLHLSSAEDLDRFDARFAMGRRVIHDFCSIGWSDVAEEYQGILIVPYIWERRLSLECQWYYAWDCASGCIWDAAAVKSVKLRQTAEAA